ncbi:glycosyl transferase [Pedobacter sp. HMF7647]|uniref:Glycosyl transferase n=1 Tax=Hufsiella arboris TaxID=2695275 RepID=A0A7K1YBE6_9SPHI|nr:glycosyltransferase family protein [Hufsiella arboris]MXV51681.1 glycosyl transferase [Hufsiella arboris]
MKILYAIQGTGNGHTSRAREIIPLLQRHGEVDVLVSGTQADILPDQPITHHYHGFSFIFGEKGGVDHWKTYRSMNLPRLWKDIKSFPLKQYNLIINDYEPVTAWACRLQHRNCIALSHQSSFLSDRTPRPVKQSNYTEWLFKYYAPSTHKIGFHFERYEDFIHTPVIRSQIRQTESKDLGHVTVYLPAYSDQTLLKYLKLVPEVKFEVFSKHSKIPFTDTNVAVRPVNNSQFNISLANCHGLLTGGGFEGPAEALFLGKKVIMLPMKFQYEQQCNAEAAKRLGVPVVYHLDDSFVLKLKSWLHSDVVPKVSFPDETESIIDNLVNRYAE